MSAISKRLDLGLSVPTYETRTILRVINVKRSGNFVNHKTVNVFNCISNAFSLVIRSFLQSNEFVRVL